MKTISKKEIDPVLMSVRNEPSAVIKDGFVYDYVGIGWVKNRAATEADKETIHVLVE